MRVITAVSWFRRPHIDKAGLLLELGTALLTVVAIVRFVLDWRGAVCLDCGLNSGYPEAAFEDMAILLLYSDPTLQVLAVILGVLVVLVAWRRIFM